MEARPRCGKGSEGLKRRAHRGRRPPGIAGDMQSITKNGNYHRWICQSPPVSGRTAIDIPANGSNLRKPSTPRQNEMALEMINPFLPDDDAVACLKALSGPISIRHSPLLPREMAPNYVDLLAENGKCAQIHLNCHPIVKKFDCLEMHVSPCRPGADSRALETARLAEIPVIWLLIFSAIARAIYPTLLRIGSFLSMSHLIQGTTLGAICTETKYSRKC
jgi:hypothetical protein